MFNWIGILLLSVSVSIGFVSHANAGIDTYEFEDPEDQGRYRQFIEELRCPKCKNQNLAGSNAPIAQDLRRELHRLIEEGETDTGIVDFMVDRYGDFVLYRPPLQKNTYILWFGPVVMLLIALIALGFIIFNRSKTPATNKGLTVDEQRKLDTFLSSTNSKKSHSDSTNKK